MKYGACQRWNDFAPQVQNDLSDQRAPNEEHDLDECSLAAPVSMKTAKNGVSETLWKVDVRISWSLAQRFDVHLQKEWRFSVRQVRQPSEERRIPTSNVYDGDSFAVAERFE